MGGDNLTVNTYLALRHRGHNVRMSSIFPAGELCVSHYDYIKRKNLVWNSFVVAIRADRPLAVLCEHQIVQNARLADMQSSHFIPCWPQPGLVPRDRARGSRISRIAFFGWKLNLSPEFRSDSFRNQLRDLGVDLDVCTNSLTWMNYSDVDLTLAVRGRSARALLTKPSLKLVNSWRAGVPALLGPEPAFEDLRESELDYFRIHTPDQVIEAIQKLRREEGLYAQMVENGLRRAQEFTFASVARAWERVLAGEIAQDYKHWKRGPRMISIPARILKFGYRCVYYTCEKTTRNVLHLKYQ